ncbi:glycosyltransferase family 2 protein [Cohnella pontilimi]|uniref:Glycosyltransferase family 2 protein n=1 Tax=Cohnella pontilimi TaxID=2564100 RepID=A0A4U0F8B9_9BACL|nr:glycosyltransferase family 2 protein [Cohnella pontilimi]TJY40871.1 glycosyltransferase family 2 protein [Cohnella pontilimi]
MNVCIIIPAYNEERSIFQVIRRILQLHPDFTVLVVNDGSSDRTEQVAKSAGAHVITLPQNLGIGGAVQTGYRYAAARGYDAAVQVDADGQHKPEELDKVLEPIRLGEADMVVGSRFVERTGYRSSAGRRTGIVILSSLVTLFARQPLKDVTSGFRAINRKVIEMFAEDYSTDYPEVDSLILVKKEKFRIKEVPVEMEQRQSGRSSITSLKSVYYMVKVSLSIMMKSFR